MAMDPINSALVEAMKTAVLEGRFQGMTLKNYDADSDEMRGCFSVVFKAQDIVENRDVAIKFYDLSMASANNDYRRAAFKREPAILTKLLGAKRCLQLVSPLTPYTLTLPLANGESASISAEYFVQEWLEVDLDTYFLDQAKHSAEERLLVFNEIVLAVEALHARGVSHRDLKYNNLRMRTSGSERTIVAIDYGTAAHISTANILGDYPDAAGACAYAAPEARCGLAGIRRIAYFNDYFALGSMLYELFDHDQFFVAYRATNPTFDHRLYAMRAALIGANSDDEKIAAWHQALSKLGSGISAVRLGNGSISAPPAIRPLVQEIVSMLTDIDYRKRGPSLMRVRGLLWSAVRILRSEFKQKIRLERARAARQIELDRLRQRQARLLSAIR